LKSKSSAELDAFAWFRH